jgi:hypothetical protein
MRVRLGGEGRYWVEICDIKVGQRNFQLQEKSQDVGWTFELLNCHIISCTFWPLINSRDRRTLPTSHGNLNKATGVCCC